MYTNLDLEIHIHVHVHVHNTCACTCDVTCTCIYIVRALNMNSLCNVYTYMYMTACACSTVMAEHCVWQQSQWKSVNCQEVEEVTTRQMDMVRALPSYAQSWDLYQYLHSYLETTQVRIYVLLLYNSAL